jgi:anti-sigma regulatory factor (Ser/Thr protein kinase)
MKVMGQVNATFKNNYGDSRAWVIKDYGIDPNAPRVIFSDYLGPDDATAALGLYSSDGVYGKASYQRSDGAETMVDDITDGSEVRME